MRSVTRTLTGAHRVCHFCRLPLLPLSCHTHYHGAQGGTEEASSWKFEEIGDTDVDLSDYYKKSETYSATAIDGKLELKQDKLTAGTNVEITEANVVNVKEDETTVKLSEDLYTYTNIGSSSHIGCIKPNHLSIPANNCSMTDLSFGRSFFTVRNTIL